MGREEFSFHVGDYVEDVYGNVGYIKDFCACEKCVERGFYEPIVQFKSSTEYITKHMYENIEQNYNRIGSHDLKAMREKKNVEIVESNDDIMESIKDVKITQVDSILLNCITDDENPAVMEIDTSKASEVFIESLKDDNGKSLTIHIEGDFNYVITD